MLKNAVINNLVPEDRRGILFSSHFPEEEEEDNSQNEIFKNTKSNNNTGSLEERIDKLEIILKKLIDYIVGNQSERSGP